MARRSNSRKRRVRRKQLGRAERRVNAAKWLSGTRVRGLLELYCKRYGVPEADAYIELLELGFQDELRIEYFEKGDLLEVHGRAAIRRDAGRPTGHGGVRALSVVPLRVRLSWQSIPKHRDRWYSAMRPTRWMAFCLTEHNP